jgi:hypothetical protein
MSTFACYLLHAGFLVNLIFPPEDGSDMLLRNSVDVISQKIKFL